jgi:hypothetical protein
MTEQRDFDRLARAWLELGPDLAPERSIAAVLQAVETTPQVRPWLRRPIWRDINMNRFAIAAGAVAVFIFALGGGLLLTRGQPGTGAPAPTASPSPGASPSPSDAGAELPAALAVTWNGEPRAIPGLGTSTRTRLTFTPETFVLTGDTYRAALNSDASIAASGELRLVTPAVSGTCAAGDVGLYPWSVSPGGTTLTVQPGTDPCPARAAALPGTWYTSTDCKVDPGGCLGTLEAGTFKSQYIDPSVGVGGAQWAPAFGAVTYTVPDGWANSQDWPNAFSLTPSADYANETDTGPVDEQRHGLTLFVHPTATDQADCSLKEAAGVDPSVDGLISFVASLPSLAAGQPQAITIDGHAGKWIDVALDPDWTGRCSDSFLAESAASDRQSGAGQWGVGIVGAERRRLIFLDLGNGDVLLIDIDSADPTRFDDLVTQSMPIVESFKFE